MSPRLRLKSDRLAELIYRSSLSQNHWAIKLGVSRSFLSDLVNGKKPFPGPATRKKLLNGFGVSFDELFHASDGGDFGSPSPDTRPQAIKVEQALSETYVFDRMVGSGGMGWVYLAREVKHGRRVAIKIMDPSVVASIGPEQFLREIRYTATLHHPYILPLLDSGTVADGVYYVTPFVAGGSLREKIDAGPLSVAESVGICAQIGRALTAAHRNRIVHCDLKPENVLLTHDGVAVLADFGLARTLREEDVDWRKRPIGSSGTAAYVSPELVSGDRVDERSDIYSLGCLLYEMLAGKPPFTGQSVEEVASRRFVEEPPPLFLTRPDVGETLSFAVSQALDSDPARRPRTVVTFLNRMAEPRQSQTAGIGCPQVNSNLLMDKCDERKPQACSAQPKTESRICGRCSDHPRPRDRR